MKNKHSYLKRLPPEYYRGLATVHWSMTIDERKTGWLDGVFHARLREILTHAAFRYGFACPIYCCMPDHFHLLCMGILPECDQRKAARYFRKHLNALLDPFGFRLQDQGYDRVLRGDEGTRSAIEEVFEYIARNPVRSGIVAEEDVWRYPFTGCLLPGYPELRVGDADFWERAWRILTYVQANGLTLKGSPAAEGAKS
ncbi:MAG: hypothetical protein K1X57_14795 [Gemmataceae bacterium]|nr:hypothetical protein [Gemmataceae bacterium]